MRTQALCKFGHIRAHVHRDANLGAHTTHFDENKNEPTHHFVPWLFMFTKGESEEAFTMVIDSFKEIVTNLYDISEPCIKTLTMDHCWAAENALNAGCRDAFALSCEDGRNIQCWVHAARKIDERMRKEHTDEDINEKVGKVVEILHGCRSQAMFDGVADVLDNYLREEDEFDLADYLKKFYLSSPWSTWWYAASGIPGVLPNQNPLESAWKVIKVCGMAHALFKMRTHMCLAVVWPESSLFWWEI